MSGGAIAGLSVGMVILGIIIGLIIGFFVSRFVTKRHMKKNPPITKDVIRMLYSQIGRKPNEQQVNDLYNKATRASNKK